jgi:transcriptional regulator with XRE-family HTH domain
MTGTVNISTSPSDDAGVLATISRHIRTRRQARKLSLDALAARSGVSKGMLVQIEKGTTNPSIGTLCRVAGALGASIADLVDVAPNGRDDVVLAAAPRLLWKGRHGGRATLLVGSSGPDMLELWEWELRPRERYDAIAHPPGTLELVHVTRGRLGLIFGSTTYLVPSQRAATAFTDRPHSYACVGSRPVHFTMVVMEWHTANDSDRAGRAGPPARLEAATARSRRSSRDKQSRAKADGASGAKSAKKLGGRR